MTRHDDVRYARPASVSEAAELRASHPDWLVLAGGTDVEVDLRHAEGPAGVLDVFGVGELHGVLEQGPVIRIGACTTYAELLAEGVVRDRLPLLHAAAADVAAVQIRNRGTIGGNAVTASPIGDMHPALLALDAFAVVASVSGPRSIPYERFLTGYRQVDLAPTELLVALEVPVPSPGTVQHWRKVGTRAAQALSKLSVAAAMRLTDGRLTQVRLAFGGVAERALRVHEAEAIAEGGSPTPELAEAVRSAVAASLHPISDVRSTADYRRDVAAALAARVISSFSRH